MVYSVSCFTSPLGVKFAFKVELYAVMIAIAKAKELRHACIWIECDNMYVVQYLLARDPNVLWPLRMEWQDCLNVLSNMQVHVSHIYKEKNCVVDKLSTMGIDLRQIKWWDYYPFQCNDLMMRDMLGKENFRFSS